MATMEELERLTPIEEEIPRRKAPTMEELERLTPQDFVSRLLGIPPIKTLVGTGQEMAEFLTGIPRMFGADIRAPRVVETGLPEKLGAGALEYMLGGGALRAAPVIQRGIQAARQIPVIGRAITAPMAQRAAGAAAMGAIERPERPALGAAMGAAISPAVELGFKVPSKAVDFMTKSRWSPFHYMMMPHVRREFDEFLTNIGQKLGLTKEHDVDKALFGGLSNIYNIFTVEAGKLYKEARDAFKAVKYPINWKLLLGKKTSPTIDKIMKDYEKATDVPGIQIMNAMQSLKRKMKNPVDFRRQLHKSEREALKTGNMGLFENLEKVEKNFDKSIDELTLRSKDTEVLNALGILKKADEYFKTNIVPFRKRGRVKLEEGKSKMIPTEFFKAHIADTSKNLTKKIRGKIEDLEHMAKFKPMIKDYLKFGHLKEGLGNPETFMKNYKVLTKEQKEAIFSKDEISRLNKFLRIYEKNPTAFREESIAAKALSPAITGAITALASPFAHMAHIPHIPSVPLAVGGLAGILGALGGRAGLRGMAKIPAVRERYIRGMTEEAAKRPSAEGIRDIVTGALLGTTRD